MQMFTSSDSSTTTTTHLTSTSSTSSSSTCACCTSTSTSASACTCTSTCASTSANTPSPRDADHLHHLHHHNNHLHHLHLHHGGGGGEGVGEGGGGGGGAGEKNGSGHQMTVSRGEDGGSLCTRRRMLVCLDLLCLCIASIPFFACELKAVTPHRRGFFCGDSSITYPFVPREAIPDSLLIAGGIAITGLSIAVGECYRVRFCSVHSRAFVRNRYVSCLYKELGSFVFGCCVGQSLTNMAKLSVGRLRPNFLSVCNVTYASLRCTPGAYVAEPPCQPISIKLVEEARKSFFSGHASFAMYTMLYLAFYLQARLSWRGARLLRPLVQFLLLMIAVYTGLSRISDYRHHPSDVVTGFVQGGLTAYWVAFHISSMFKPCVRQDLSPACTSLESPLSSQQTVC